MAQIDTIQKDVDMLLLAVDNLSNVIDVQKLNEDAVATLSTVQALANRLQSNYYDKSECYSKEEVDALIESLRTELSA